MKPGVCLFSTVLLATIACHAEPAAMPAPWGQDCVPPAWTNITVQWKATWNDTMAANYSASGLTMLTRKGDGPGNSRELDTNGWITVWQISGPYMSSGMSASNLFDVPFAPEKNENAVWKVFVGGGGTPWRVQFLDISGGYRAAYICADVWSPDARQARLELGTDDGVKAWLNGKPVHSNNTYRTWEECQDIVPIHLQAGWNLLMLKITQDKGPWDASAKIRAPDGRELAGLRLAHPTLQDEQCFRLRHITLLEAMLQHFPRDDHRPRAYTEIAEEYLTLGDRTRALQWYGKMILEFSDRNDLVANACYGILSNAYPFDSMPDLRKWIDFASGKLREIEQTSPASLNAPTLQLARWMSCAVLSEEQRYPDLLRLLISLREKSGSEPWWFAQWENLMSNVGFFSRATEPYIKAGNYVTASNILARLRKVAVEDSASLPPKELVYRWQAVQDELKTASPTSEMDASSAQEVLRLSAESDAMIAAGHDSRVQFWVDVERSLRGSKAAYLQPLRDMEEQKARSSAAEIRRTGDRDALVRLFRRYPWAQSVHELLAEAGENALHDGHISTAVRFFEDVATHSTDPDLQAQARVGLWLALAQEPGAREELAGAMATVPDNDNLPWRGVKTPAGTVKAAVLAQTTPDTAQPVDPANLKRTSFRLPPELASDNPAMQSSTLAPWGLGPWAIGRIEQAGNRVSFIGPRSVACFGTGSSTSLWFNVESGLLYPDAEEPDLDARDHPSPVARAVAIGAAHCSAVAAYRPDVDADGTASRRALCVLISMPDAVDFAPYSLTAFDSDNGKPVWNTRNDHDWHELTPINAPTASDGCVFALALGPVAREYRPLYLVCLGLDDGKIAWKRRIATISTADRNAFELALGGSPVTVHRGSIYVSTDMGLTGRFDLRDGMAEWIQAYTNSLDGTLLNLKFRREGPSPLVAGDKVIVAPRDHTGVLALSRDSGRILWETPLATSDHIAGVAGNAIILTAGRTISALDVNSGKELWSRTADESTDVQAIVSGQEVVALAGDKLSRLAASTGREIATLPVPRSPATELVLLRDATILDIGEQKSKVQPEKNAGRPGPFDAPAAETWQLPCEQPDLVWPAPGNGPAHMFAVSSGRSVMCVKTQPRFELMWKRRFRYCQESLGFHGNLTIAACNRTLTALDVADGATKWSISLPYRADIVCGNEQVIVAGHRSSEGKLTAVDPTTGRVTWSRWYGNEIRFRGRMLHWATLRKDDSGKSLLSLYLGRPPTGTEDAQMLEAIVDAGSGVVTDVRTFLPDEAEWPRVIAFGNDTRFSRGVNMPAPWPRQGPFLPDAITYIGKDSLVRCIRGTPPRELVPGWSRTMDAKPEERIQTELGIHPAASGAFVRSIGRLELVEKADSKGIVYAISQDNPARTAFDILDFRESTGTVMVVSATENGNDRYTWRGLQDCSGTGSVTVCFTGKVQFVNTTRQLQEAGSNPSATLLNGIVRPNRPGAMIVVTGLSSLGWSGRNPKYDVYLYGFSGTVSLNEGRAVECPAPDYSSPSVRTSFVANVNVVKFPGVRGDDFSLTLAGNAFSAIQIVRAATRLVDGKPTAIGLNWTGGGPALRPEDVVGANFAHGNWYNINADNVLFGGPPSSGIPSTSPAGPPRKPLGPPVAYVDIFSRDTGQLMQSIPLQTRPQEFEPARYRSQARILDNAIITTDPKGIHVFRSTTK